MPANSADDFAVITENGKLLGPEGEFNRKQFEEMMRGELLRYSRRQLSNTIMSVSCNEYHHHVTVITCLIY